MSVCNYVDFVNAQGTLSRNANVIIVDCPASSGITGTITAPYQLTLPQIISDNGVTYQIIRVDTRDNAYIQARGFGTQNIIYSNLSGVSGSTGPVFIFPSSKLELTSYLRNWYVTYNSATTRVPKVIYSSSYRTATINGITIGGSSPGSGTLTYFPYQGMISEPITKVFFTLSNPDNSFPNLSLSLVDFSTGLTICGITGMSGTLFGQYTTENIQNLNLSPTIIAINYNKTVGNISTRLLSILVT